MGDAEARITSEYQTGKGERTIDPRRRRGRRRRNDERRDREKRNHPSSRAGHAPSLHEGRTRAEVASEFREEYERWEHDPYTFAPAGGESGLQVTARALPRLLKLVEQHDSMPFVIVSHKATIRLLLSSLLAFDPRKYRDRLDQSPAALNIIDFKDVTHPRLMLFNDVSHYDRDVPGEAHSRLSPIWSAG